MSLPRRTLPILERSCKLCPQRPFYTVSRLAAKARQSPKLAQKAKAAQGPRPGSAGTHVAGKTIYVPKAINPEDALPPITLLNSGHKSGAFDISPQKALDLLRRYQELARKPTTGWEQKLCDDYGASKETLYLLAKILNRCPTNAQRSLARKVMHSASSLGVKTATYELIESSLLKGTLNLEEFSTPLRRLGVLAKQEQDPQAMALLGKVMQSLGKEEEALDWFCNATKEGIDFEGASEALVQQGRILLSQKDRQGAEEAFKRAALGLDDPWGYFYLSQLQPPGSSEQEVYLLKAASSGVVEASHNLGSLELGRIEKRAEGMHDFGMAKEWFSVAAAEGFGLSMLNLALIYKAGGQADEGLKWLEKAEELPEIKKEARKVRAQWGNERVQIS